MTAAPDPTVLADRRATVARLRLRGHSLRTIAEQTGVSKDTVARDLDAVEKAVEALARATATPPDQDPSATAAPQEPAVSPPPETPAPRPAPPSHDTETPPARPAVPCLTVPLDLPLMTHLATLTHNGTSPRDALFHAVALVADTYRQAWNAGLYPRTVDPVIARHQYTPYQPPAPTPDAGTTP